MKKLHLNILWILMLVIFVVPCYSASVSLIEENLKEALVKKDWDKVIETANTWNEQEKTTPVPYLVLAYAYYTKGDYQKVSQSLGPIDSQEKKEFLLGWTEEFVREYPQSSLSHLLKGDSYIRLKKYDDAVKEFDKAKELDQVFFLVYVAKGMLYTFQNNYDLAINNFTQAIKLQPNLADLYNNRGIVYYCQKKCELALADFEQAVKKSPTFTLAYLGQGRAHQCLGKADLASDDFQKAKEISREGISFSQTWTKNPAVISPATILPASGKWTPSERQLGGELNLGVLKGVDSEPKGKTKKIRKGEVVSEKTPDDNFITSASYFLLYRDQFLFKEKGE